MARIAIVGTEGTGKTILMAVLARAFRRKESGICLVPMSRQTAQYTEDTWSHLKNGEWPPSTPDGSHLELNWELRIEGAAHSMLEFRDISGQDFRELFGDEEINRYPELSPDKVALADHILSANVIAFLVNLADFVGTSEERIKVQTQSQWALKKALDWLQAQGSARRCAVIFSQADQYRQLAKQLGGWTNVAAKYLPYVYESHLSDRRVTLHAIAAVSNTRVVKNEQGKPCRVPASDVKWECPGILPLMQWFCRSAKELPSAQGGASAPISPVIDRNASIDSQPIVDPKGPTLPPPLPGSQQERETNSRQGSENPLAHEDTQWKKQRTLIICIGAVLTLIVVFALISGGGGRSGKKTSSALPTTIRPGADHRRVAFERGNDRLLNGSYRGTGRVTRPVSDDGGEVSINAC